MANIEEIRKKVDKLIEEKGLNYRDVSLRIGRKDSYIQQYVRYGYPRRLKEMDRVRLAKLLDIDDTEIMDDEIIATKTLGTPESTPHLLGEFIEANSVPDNQLLKIDVLNSSSEAIDKTEYLNDIIGKHFISKNVLLEMTSVKSENIKIVKIISDSMKPLINSGDTIWFDSSYDYANSDGLYLFLNGREPSIKRIEISPIDGSVEISSANNSYKTYRANSCNEVKVLGKIFYLMQKI